RWTYSRLTLSYGVRYDYFTGYTPPQDVPANRFLPARHFDRVDDVVSVHDLSPRFGASYDVFGNSKTALKMTLNRYVGLLSTGEIENSNPVVTSVLSATRTWTDTNGNFLPDCNFG